jgi:hypothetical protein
MACCFLGVKVKFITENEQQNQRMLREFVKEKKQENQRTFCELTKDKRNI